jgi:hypothetical protein
MRVIDPADFLFENEVLERWPMLTKAELRRARRANPPRIEFYSFRKKSGGPRYTPEQVQSYIDHTYLRKSECPQINGKWLNRQSTAVEIRAWRLLSRAPPSRASRVLVRLQI